MADRVAEALAEVAEVLSGVDGDGVAAACRMIASAEAIGVYGCGREGFQMRGLAMRLFHLGRPVGYVGETTMPALGRGGLLVVSSGPGGLATVAAHMATARAARASVLLMTAQPDAPNAGGADLVLTVPAQTMATDRQSGADGILPMGSVYEAALFFLCEWIVADLKAMTGETAGTMRARHTNME